ncbi:MAG: DNA repair protein RecN [Pseudomonadota bacterium]
MLASLTIKNIVLIDHLVIEFDRSLSALTGETGAGKSILLDSLGLALGARADSGLVRHGTDKASVIAEFDLMPKHRVFKILEENDVESDGGQFIVRRTLTNDGRSKAYINDQPISIGLLKQIGVHLVEIHGQFDTHNLLDSKYHLGLLDDYGTDPIALEKLKTLWQSWQEQKNLYQEKRAAIEKARADEEYFRTSLEDLDRLDPKENEEESLSTLRERLMKREQFVESLGQANEGLSEIENIMGSVWRAVEKLGEDGIAIQSSLDAVNAEVQEVSHNIQSTLSDIENSEYSLSEIDDRLFALKAQARKFNCSINDLPQKRDEIAQLLNDIEGEDDNLNALEKQVKEARENYKNQAVKITQIRQDKAMQMADLVMKELAPLKLDKARFVVQIEEKAEENWNASGMDQVQFLIATNPGSAPGPLSKVASGGEMARFTLALKVILAEVGSAGTLVFDEVDTGIGGATASAVGERLAKLAAGHQILVVTHSPQVAAMASHHYIVSKQGEKDLKTQITHLRAFESRQDEIARMLSGAEITKEAQAAAVKLLETAPDYKKQKTAA